MKRASGNPCRVLPRRLNSHAKGRTSPALHQAPPASAAEPLHGLLPEAGPGAPRTPSPPPTAEKPMTDTLPRDEPAVLTTSSPDTVPQQDDPGQSWSCGPFGYWPA